MPIIHIETSNLDGSRFWKGNKIKRRIKLGRKRESEEMYTVKLSDSVMDDADKALIAKCKRDELLRELLTLRFVGRREKDWEEWERMLVAILRRWRTTDGSSLSESAIARELREREIERMREWERQRGVTGKSEKQPLLFVKEEREKDLGGRSKPMTSRRDFDGMHRCHVEPDGPAYHVNGPQRITASSLLLFAFLFF